MAADSHRASYQVAPAQFHVHLLIFILLFLGATTDLCQWQDGVAGMGPPLADSKATCRKSAQDQPALWRASSPTFAAQQSGFGYSSASTDH